LGLNWTEFCSTNDDDITPRDVMLIMLSTYYDNYTPSIIY